MVIKLFGKDMYERLLAKRFVDLYFRMDESAYFFSNREIFLSRRTR
jgi:hypothetical protein